MSNTLKYLLLIVAGIISVYVSDKVFRITEMISSLDRKKKLLQEKHLVRFNPLIKDLPASIEFQENGKKHRLTDPADIKKFFALVHDGTEVAAHHTHPERKISVTLAGCPDQYLLGRDSGQHHEYWLELVDPGVKPAETTIWHFHSIPMEDWLKALAEKIAQAKELDPK